MMNSNEKPKEKWKRNLLASTCGVKLGQIVEED